MFGLTNWRFWQRETPRVEVGEEKPPAKTSWNPGKFVIPEGEYAGTIVHLIGRNSLYNGIPYIVLKVAIEIKGTTHHIFGNLGRYSQWWNDLVALIPADNNEADVSIRCTVVVEHEATIYQGQQTMHYRTGFKTVDI